MSRAGLLGVVAGLVSLAASPVADFGCAEVVELPRENVVRWEG